MNPTKIRRSAAMTAQIDRMLRDMVIELQRLHPEAQIQLMHGLAGNAGHAPGWC